MHKSILTKLSIILIVFLFGSSLSACSKEEEPIDETPEIEVDDEEEGVALSIPADFPSDLIPIYPNSHLYSVVAVNQSFTIMFYSKDDVSNVINFYKNVFKDATDKMETNQDNSYTIFGALGGYTFTFDCGPNDELEGYQTLVVLSVIMSQK